MAKPGTKSKMKIENKKCITPTFRVSFEHIFKRAVFKGKEGNYGLTMLFDKKKADLTKLKCAVKNAAIEAWGEDESDWPEGWNSPFRDADKDPKKKKMPGYPGHYFVSCTAKEKPGLVDSNLDPILDASEFYSGCYARAEVIAFAYDVSGNTGISLALQNVQKVKDGPKFSGKKDAAEVFTMVESDIDDDDSASKDDDDSDDVSGF